ncbi:MAG: cytochrome c [Bacteroidetes bacterium]|nr:MAG: cytochrome c [Bacteroidota bacterium]
MVFMKQLLTFCTLVVIIWACGNSSGDSTQTPPADASAKASPDGKKIYKQYCVTCHGLYGDMGASGAYNLTESKLTLEERIHVITKGRGAMTPFENLLDEDEIKAVAKYTLELKQ